MSAGKPPHEPPRWLDDRRNVDKIYYGLIAACALLAGADLFYHKHVHFEAEHIFAAYGLYGFVCCVGLVLAAKELRKLLKRAEDYYDDGE
jgi:hypothetical protein